MPADAGRLINPVNNFITDWFERIVIGFFGRAGSHSNHKIHIGMKADMISCTAQRWPDIYPPRCTVDINVHENIKTDGYLIGQDAIGRERLDQITKATTMWLLMTVDNAKGV